MEVTRKNFNFLLPEISASIDKADFLVIDAEFTGIINGRDVSMFDNPQEYYMRLLNGSSDFLLIQYGICAFYWNEQCKHYMNDAYNFYLFPRGRPGPEKTFLCQSSSLDFLAAQGFDFNKLIREGISYMTEPTESRLREQLTERQKNYSIEKDIITVPEENKQQIEDICKQVQEFIHNKRDDDMVIEKCNAFVRRLLFQELGTRFKHEVFVESKVLENKDRILKVTRIKSSNDGKNRDDKKKEKEWEDFEDAVGFSKVARMISQSDKLVIGHNMLLDILHTLNHFFQPLPADYSAFKEFTHCMFPKLLDTKYMSSLPPFKDKVNSSVLQHLLGTLSEAPFSLPKIDCEAGRGYSQAHEKNHEAGYDAYVTGLCFLAMHSHLAKMRGDSDQRVRDSVILKPFLNKIFLSKTAHQDSPYINLVGDDPIASRDHVFHMTFPKEWQRSDINQLFSPFGPVIVQFMDDVSALVALSRREQSRDVLRTVGKGSRVTLVPYVKYKHMLAKGNQDKHWFKVEETSILTNTPDSAQKPRQVNSSTVKAQCVGAPPAPAPQSPLKERPRRSSTSVTSQVTSPNKKRTSSGVFTVEETEPPPKKAGIVRSNSDGSLKEPEVMTNGRRKTENDTQKETQDTRDKKHNKVVEKFDTEAKSKCVEAFKESDSWD